MQSRLTRLARYPVLAGALALACCAPPPPVPAPPPPVAAPTPTPPPTPAPVMQEPVYENFLDAPQTPGTWQYQRDPGETFAIFGAGGADELWLVCRLATKKFGLVRAGAFNQSTPVRVRTETTQRLLTVAPLGSGEAALVKLDAADPLLDAMALSRGRFAVETAGAPTLYLPAWAEVTRVIEDCR